MAYLYSIYVWSPTPWHRKAMDKKIFKAIATKFSEKFAIIVLKKHRKFCRHGLTHLDATPIFKKIIRILLGHPVVILVSVFLMRGNLIGLRENLKHKILAFEIF